MKSRSNNTEKSVLPPLSVTELEVLWLYDCNFTDKRISKLLYLEEHEVLDIKSKLYKTFGAIDTLSLLSSAMEHGYVH